MMALARGANVFGAGVFVVAVGVFAALGAAGARTANAVVRAHGGGVVAQRGRTRVVRARVLVVATRRVGASFFLATVVGDRAILVGLAVVVVRRVATRAGKTDVIGAAYGVITI